MTSEEWINKVVETSRKKTPGQCQISGEKLTEENASPGSQGRFAFEIRVVHPDIPGTTVAVSSCKKCYLDFYKTKYPKAPTPKI